MAEKPVSIPGTIKWQPGRVIDGIRGNAVYLYAINRYGTECCLGKWESPKDAKGTPYESEVAEVFAAEELRAQGAELGENQWEDEDDGGDIWTFRNPTADGAEASIDGIHYDFFTFAPGPAMASAMRPGLIAFWARNAPADLCLTDDGRSVRKMAPNEVRDVVTGKGLGMYMVTLGAVGIGPKSSSGNAQWLYCPPRTAEQHITAHPCSLPSNRMRVEAFLAQATSGGEVPPGPPQDDKADEVQRSEPAAAVLPEAHSGSPSGEKCETCRGAGVVTVEDRWCPTCNGTGRKTEESDGLVQRDSLPAQGLEARNVRSEEPEPESDGRRSTEQAIAEEKLRAWSLSDSEHLTQFLAMKARAEKAEEQIRSARAVLIARVFAADASEAREIELPSLVSYAVAKLDDIATTRLALERGLVDGYRSLLAEARSAAARDQATREREEARLPVPPPVDLTELRARLERLIAAIALAADFSEARNRCDRMRATGPNQEIKP